MDVSEQPYLMRVYVAGDLSLLPHVPNLSFLCAFSGNSPEGIAVT